MDKMINLTRLQLFTLGNARTYAVTDADRNESSAFAMRVADTITISNGTNSVALSLAKNEEVVLDGSITTIVGTIDNTLMFLR